MGSDLIGQRHNDMCIDPFVYIQSPWQVVVEPIASNWAGQSSHCCAEIAWMGHKKTVLPIALDLGVGQAMRGLGIWHRELLECAKCAISKSGSLA